MKGWIPRTTCFAALALGVSTASGQGASPRAGTVVVPDSSAQRPADIGVRSHTNYLIFVPARKPGFDAPQGETPRSIACIYGLANSLYFPDCAISDATAAPTGGSGIINLVGTETSSTAEERMAIYGTYNSGSYSSDFTDITDGSTSSCSVNPHRPVYSGCEEAAEGWDFMTGVGSNLGSSVPKP